MRRYYRHGSLSLVAALNTRSGEALGQTVPRHTSAAFVEFLGDIVVSAEAVRHRAKPHGARHLHFGRALRPPVLKLLRRQLEAIIAKVVNS